MSDLLCTIPDYFGFFLIINFKVSLQVQSVMQYVMLLCWHLLLYEDLVCDLSLQFKTSYSTKSPTLLVAIDLFCLPESRHNKNIFRLRMFHMEEVQEGQ